MDTREYMKQINQWADDYEKAMDDGVFENAPKPPVPSSQTADPSFFGLNQTNPTPEVSSPDAEYWSQLNDMVGNSNSNYETEEQVIINEEESVEESVKPEKFDSLKGHPMVKKALSPNPVLPWTIEKDQRKRVTPNWTTGDELNELAELKKNLYDLECRLSGKQGLLEDNEKVNNQLKDLKKRLDELSDSLQPIGWKDIDS